MKNEKRKLNFTLERTLHSLFQLFFDLLGSISTSMTVEDNTDLLALQYGFGSNSALKSKLSLCK